MKISSLRLHYLVFLLDHATRNKDGTVGLWSRLLKKPWRVCGKEMFLLFCFVLA